MFPALFCFIALFCSTSAFAQDVSALPNLFTPVSGDVSMQILKSIFGGIPAFGGTGTDALQGPIGLFNQLILMVGGVMAGYTIFVGVFSTAHDGEVLGKAFHSVYVPIRTAGAAALILPVFNGYCVAQVLVAWCIVQSIGLADTVWTAFTSSNNLGAVTTVSYNPPEVYKLAHDILKAEMCMSALNTVYNGSGQNSALVPADGMTFGITSDDPSTGGTTAADVANGGAYIAPTTTTVYRFGNTSGTNGIAPDACGTVTITPYTISTMNSSLSGSTGMSLGWSTGASGPYTDSNIALINAAQTKAVKQMFSDAQTIVGNAAITINNSLGNNSPITSAQIQSINTSVDAMVGKYQNTVHQAAANAMNSAEAFSDIAANASQDGWLLTGAWYMKLAQLQDRTQRAINDVPTSAASQNFQKGTPAADAVLKYMVGLQTLTSTSSAGGDFGIEKQKEGETFTNTGWDFGAAITKGIANLLNFSINDNDNPVMTVKRGGDWMFTLAAGLLAFSELPILKVVLSPLVMFLFVIGGTGSFGIPFTPFLLWLGAAGAWIMLAVEAMIIAPLWVVMALNPHANDLLGSSKRGLQLILNLTLRPVLMVFGFAVATVVMQVFGVVLNHVFSAVYYMTESSSNIFAAIAGAIFSVIIYMVTEFLLIKKIFGAIHTIPDQALQWIGGPSANLTEGSRNIAAGVGMISNQIDRGSGALRTLSGNAAASQALNGLGGKGNAADMLKKSLGGASGSTRVGDSGGSSGLGEFENLGNLRNVENTLDSISQMSSPDVANALRGSELMQGNSQQQRELVSGMHEMISNAVEKLDGNIDAVKNYADGLASSINDKPGMNKGELLGASASALAGAMGASYGETASAVAKTGAERSDGTLSKSDVESIAGVYQKNSSAMNDKGIAPEAQQQIMNAAGQQAMAMFKEAEGASPMKGVLQTAFTQAIQNQSTSDNASAALNAAQSAQAAAETATTAAASAANSAQASATANPTAPAAKVPDGKE
ncbi:DotA/TraY family protein [Paraburkholderia tropica]|uniref:DotA/TraY family protein n=1 Tax=Paraburkholderia tropica TaxID=92647 RepID=UPI003D2AE13C